MRDRDREDSGPAAAAESPAVAPDTVAAIRRTLTLWFAAPSGDSLVSEPRAVLERDPGGQTTLHDRVATLVSELARGSTAGAGAVLPPGTAALHVFLDGRGLLTLDLSRPFRDDFTGGSTAEYLTLSALARTLAGNVPEVRRVRIVCEGAPLATLGGHLPLDQPLELDEWP